MRCPRNLPRQGPVRLFLQKQSVDETDHCPDRKEDAHDHDRDIVKRTDDDTETRQPVIRNILVHQKGKLQAEDADHMIRNQNQFPPPGLLPLLRKEVIYEQGYDHKPVECKKKGKTVHLHLDTELL